MDVLPAVAALNDPLHFFYSGGFFAGSDSWFGLEIHFLFCNSSPHRDSGRCLGGVLESFVSGGFATCEQQRQFENKTRYID